MKPDRARKELVAQRDAGAEARARLERALVVAAYIVARHGAAYAPYLDRLEKEIEAAGRDDPGARARRILERYAVEVKAVVVNSSVKRIASGQKESE